MRDSLYILCDELAVGLDTPPALSGTKLLRAIAQVESSGGAQNIPRFERAYSVGGHYFRRAQHVRDAWGQYGDLAACSYGPWQILYIVALELGYNGAPWQLTDPPESGPMVVKLLNRRIFGKGARTLAEVGDAYNSGSFADQMVPEEYIEKLEAAYRDEPWKKS